MTAQTQSRTHSGTGLSARLAAIALSAFIGLSIVTIAGHVQTSALHAAAHDTRHATGFPCH